MVSEWSNFRSGCKAGILNRVHIKHEEPICRIRMYSLIEHLPFEGEKRSYPRMIMQLEQSKSTASLSQL
jgi:hypothetical protein